MAYRSQYDEIADTYESLHKTRDALVENRMVMGMLGYESGSILDIGCGTGLFLDYNKPALNDYIGIDPSRKMLEIFRMKHPEYRSQVIGLEDYEVEQQFDSVVALFGSISYVDEQTIKKIPEMLDDNGSYFLMFYKPDYCPITYRMTNAHISHYKHDRDVLPNADVTEFNNFFILTGGKI